MTDSEGNIMAPKEHDFAMERRLREADPELHRRFTDAVFSLQHILSNYKLLFPEYTDHTELHSLTVIDFCNRLIGDQIGRMNADETYVLLMGCYFHDTGMGVTQKDYEAFSKEIDFGDYFKTHSRENIPAIIRDFHHEYSGRFIRKYAEFFEIPSEEHLWAIMEVARGHRKTMLTDEKAYPPAMPFPGGATVCLPYLSALIRLADEIDVASARNSPLLYDIGSITDDTQRMYHKRTRAVRDLLVSADAFTILADAQEPEILDAVRKMAEKMSETLEECRRAVNGRTPYQITQERIVVKMMK